MRRSVGNEFRSVIARQSRFVEAEFVGLLVGAQYARFGARRVIRREAISAHWLTERARESGGRRLGAADCDCGAITSPARRRVLWDGGSARLGPLGRGLDTLKVPRGAGKEMPAARPGGPQRELGTCNRRWAAAASCSCSATAPPSSRRSVLHAAVRGRPSSRCRAARWKAAGVRSARMCSSAPRSDCGAINGLSTNTKGSVLLP